MSFIAKNKTSWRTLVLALFIISMLGPWAFDLLNVPAQYPCEKPSVRLYGDFCGYPMSGFGVLIWTSGGFFYILAELIKGNIAVRIPELVIPICAWIIILPFFSTLLLIWKKNSRRLQTINLVTWGLACLLTCTMFIWQTNRDQFVRFFHLLWGIWLYILVATGTIILEIRARSNIKPGRDI
jgi:hypothetical protein